MQLTKRNHATIALVENYSMSSTAKRWFQLSMLQMLVAMAVVATFTFKNTSYHQKAVEVGINRISAGWPFTYLAGYGMLATTTSEFVRAGDPLFAGMPKYSPWILTMNIALCCLTTVAAVKTVTFVSRKCTPCPSTST